MLQVTDKEAPITLPKFLVCVEAETTDDNSRTSNQTQKTSTKIVLPNKIKDLKNIPPTIQSRIPTQHLCDTTEERDTG